MSWSPHLRNFRLPGVNQNTVEPDQVTAFSILELPFRMRLGRFRRWSLQKGIEIIWLNRIHLPKASGYSVESLPLVKDRHLLNTRICILENPTELGSQELEAVRGTTFSLSTEAARLIRSEPEPGLLVFPNHDRLLEAVRRFVTLYFKYCPPEFAGDRVRPIWLDDFYSFGIVHGLCVRPPGEIVPDSFIRTLLRFENPRMDERDVGDAFWHDASAKQQRELRKSLNSAEQPDLTNQLLLLSFAFQQQFNTEMAIITAVAAVESSLFEFARNRLGPKLNNDSELIENFLREQGVSVLSQVIPRLFFRKENVPTKEIIDGVKKAITARNNIMHGKVDKEGRPKHLNQGNLGMAIGACNELIAAFKREKLR